MIRVGELHDHLVKRVIGQNQAVAVLAEALMAGEMGHTPRGRPKTFALLAGPTGTGKTKAVLEASRFLFGTEAVARVNCAEFATDARVPLLLGTEGKRGLLGATLDDLRASGGKILLLDEIEKANRMVSDLFLGMEAAEITLGNNEKVDLSDFHILNTSNVGSADLADLDEGVPWPTLKWVVETAAKEQFRPEVFARFTHLAIFNKHGNKAQLAICEQMLTEEVEFQRRTLAQQFGHEHTLGVGPGVYRRLVSEGFHPLLGMRPMRNVVEQRVRNAIVRARRNGVLVPGVSESWLVLEGNDVKVAAARRGLRLVG